jgi:hypothetical protein
MGARRRGSPIQRIKEVVQNHKVSIYHFSPPFYFLDLLTHPSLSFMILIIRSLNSLYYILETLPSL